MALGLKDREEQVTRIRVGDMDTELRTTGTNLESPMELYVELDQAQLDKLLAAEAESSSVRIECQGLERPSGKEGVVRFTINYEEARAVGAQFGQTGEGTWAVTNLTSTALVQEDLGLAAGSDFQAVQTFSSEHRMEYTNRVIPESMRPDWLEYSPEVLALVSEGFSDLSGWATFTEDNIQTRFEGLQKRFPERELVPIVRRNSDDDIACLEKGKEGKIVVIHDFASPGSESVAEYDSVGEFRRSVATGVAEYLTETLSEIKQDERYQEGLSWGKVRDGHPEATISEHVAELERNVAILADEMLVDERAIVDLLVHTHDTFKGEAKGGVPIDDPQSHASIARSYVEEYLGETSISPMLQYHDELYAIWKKEQKKGEIDEVRLAALIDKIEDWDAFMTFTIVDNATAGKDLSSTQWAVDLIKEHVPLARDPQVLLDRLSEVRGFSS